MPLAFQKLDITLGAIDEGTTPKKTLPGVLDVCENATFPKKDRIDKRRGYRIVDVQTAVDGTAIAPANVFCNIANVHGELLIFGVDRLHTLADENSNLGDGALVLRGPTLRGGAEVLHVATSQISVEG